MSSAAPGGIAQKGRSGRRSAIGRDLLRLLGAALLAGAVPAAAQAPKPDAELHRAWAAGYRAAFTCPSLWNGAGKSRSEERRVGKECVSTGSSRWSPSL